MPLFDDREKAAERKFELENELAFKTLARRNKLLGIWAAGHMGLTGEDAARYAMSIVEAEIAAHDDKAIIKKVCDDLVARGFPIVEREVAVQLKDCHATAKAQLLRDTSRTP